MERQQAVEHCIFTLRLEDPPAGFLRKNVNTVFDEPKKVGEECQRLSRIFEKFVGGSDKRAERQRLISGSLGF